MNPADIVIKQLDAYNARDIAAFAATYADDACLYRMPHSELILRGRQRIIDYYGGTAFQNTSLHADIVSRQVMAVYEVHEGLIQAVWFYDPHQVSAPPAQT